MSKITNAMILEALNSINSKLDAIDKRVTTLESGKSKPTASAKGNAVATKVAKGYSTDIKDYEPKKSKDGNYNWASYKAKRTDYCYAVATEGKALGCYEKGVKVVDFKDIESAFNKAKADFTKKYKYVKVADR